MEVARIEIVPEAEHISDVNGSNNVEDIPEESIHVVHVSLIHKDLK